MQLTAARAAMALLVTAALARAAHAYPQFQFATDSSRCSLCHVSPAGGGLINDFGRDESADTISQWGSEATLGDSGFLYGALDLPSWLALGGDHRGVLLLKDAPAEPSRFLVFPMQADLYGMVKAGDLAVLVTAGWRGAARQTGASALERFLSREHYLLWRRSSRGPYVRAGRFFPPYGLRLADHTAYNRRYLGLHTLEESYGLSAGMVENQWEVHVTAFAPAPIWAVGSRAGGGAFYYERRVRGETGALAAQARIAISQDDARYLGGGVGKFYFEEQKVLILGEVNLGLQTITGVNTQSRAQLGAYAGTTYYFKPWLLFGTALERFDQDMTLGGSARDSVNLTLQYFPISHVELMWMSKFEFQGARYGSPAHFHMLMWHYYL